VKTERIFSILLSFCLICLVASCATTTISLTNNETSLNDVPLPEDIEIIEPDPALPDEIRAFSGKWSGTWFGGDGGLLKSVLIVEQINDKEAKVIYAWGDEPKWNTQAGYWRYIAKVNNQHREIKFQGVGRVFTFRIVKSGKLRGSMTDVGSGYYNTVTMKKVN